MGKLIKLDVNTETYEALKTIDGDALTLDDWYSIGLSYFYKMPDSKA